MAITTYAELKTAVSNWLQRDDLTSIIPDFIMMGEKRIFRDLRIRTMETALNVTISSGVAALPSDYVELKIAYINGSPIQPLGRRSLEWIYNAYPLRSSDGEPRFIARNGANFEFGPYPDSGYTLKGTYYARLTALSDSNTTNWFTTNAPDLLLMSALCEASPYLKDDPRIQIWESKYALLARQVKSEDKQEEASGGGLMVQVG